MPLISDYQLTLRTLTQQRLYSLRWYTSSPTVPNINARLATGVRLRFIHYLNLTSVTYTTWRPTSGFSKTYWFPDHPWVWFFKINQHGAQRMGLPKTYWFPHISHDDDLIVTTWRPTAVTAFKTNIVLNIKSSNNKEPHTKMRLDLITIKNNQLVQALCYRFF